MKDAQKPDHVSLNTLIGRLREGRFVIPDFQRDFEWYPWDIRELIRSVFLDYYIGSLLLWKGTDDNFAALSCEPIYGYQGDGRPEYIVLDGQQRLTAMYYAFLAPDVPLPNRASRAFYFIRVDHFMKEEYDDAFYYDWVTQRWSKLFRDKSSQYSHHIFPVSIVGASGWDLSNWVQGYEKYWRERADEAKFVNDSDLAESATKHADNAQSFGVHLKGITEQYQIAYIELDRNIAVDKVCDIFTQINSRGVRLDAFDLFNALLKPKGLQLKQMWREAASRLEFVDTEKMNVYILQVMSILRQAYCSPKYLFFMLPGQTKPIRNPDGTYGKEVLVRDISDFEKRWEGAVNALEDAINLLRHPQEFGAISSNYLPYVSIIPAFAALQAYTGTLPANRRLDAQKKIRHWYWASVFINRYSGSVESTTARDFLNMKAWIDDDNKEPSLILEFKNSFSTLDLRREIKRGTSVYNGIFNLLVLQGARDWMTGNVPQYGELDDHHIVPASWGNKHLERNVIHTILNRTPLTADTNRKVIRERPPNEYLRELISANDEKTVIDIFESHFISRNALDILLRDPFTPDDFEAFIAERQRTLQHAIESLLIKERIDLEPRLRELDEQIELVELRLRRFVMTALADDVHALPSHILQRIDERIHSAAVKNAALDTKHYQTLSGKLEFCDLREIQDTVVNKNLWPTFEGRFANKETLNVKFGQLAELRNGIRHSRTVDQITKKEGEAAILWFENVLRDVIL